MTGPLADLRILDLSRIVAGPLATQIFSDYGAEVLKIEQPGAGDDSRHWVPPRAPDGSASYFFAVNRGKKSVTVDLKHPRGRALVVELARRSDVLVENFTPGTVDRLGLGAATLRAENPRLVYCSISGFGATGPYRDRAGYDAIMQGFTGLMSITGEAAGPPVKVGVALIDVITALYAHGAILGALHHRERTGEGQALELSLMECGIAALINAATGYLVAGDVQGRWGHAHPSLVPYQAFRARGMAVEVDHPTAGRVRLPGIPVKFAATPAAVQGPPPRLGEHTDEVLRTVLGLDDAAIAELRASGALGA
jgi:crotonobetainyl-CoA:carnitine CoA-transferase CaiB-like acyl-CoA transferase